MGIPHRAAPSGRAQRSEGAICSAQSDQLSWNAASGTPTALLSTLFLANTFDGISDGIGWDSAIESTEVNPSPGIEPTLLSRPDLTNSRARPFQNGPPNAFTSGGLRSIGAGWRLNCWRSSPRPRYVWRCRIAHSRAWSCLAPSPQARAMTRAKDSWCRRMILLMDVSRCRVILLMIDKSFPDQAG